MDALFEHNGHVVTLTDDHRFEIAGPAFEDEGRGYKATLFDTAREARERIDARVKARERQETTRTKVAIEAVDDAGTPCTIRGINANTSALLGVPADGRGIRRIFPPVPWLVEAIKHWRDLQRQTSKAEETINRYRLDGSVGYGRIAAHEYDRKLANFLESFEKAQRAAIDAGGTNDGRS